MTLSDITTRHVPDWQHERLARWLSEWEIADDMREEEEAALPFPSGAEGQGSGDGADDSVEPGDVRLLHPTSGESWHRPVYAVVVSVVSLQRVLVAPFGPFAEPAVPGELLLRGLAPGIQVLCVWNCRVLNRDRLKRSWRVVRLSDADLARIFAVRRHIDEGVALPEEVARDVGPPLAHPLDPRHEYLARQSSSMDALVRECRAGDEAREGDMLYLGRPRSELLLAAEERADYGFSARYSVPGLAVRVTLVPLDTGESELCVTDEQHRPSAVLDGCCVRLPDGRRTPAVQGGRTTLPSGTPPSDLTLLLADGTPIPLDPV